MMEESKLYLKLVVFMLMVFATITETRIRKCKEEKISPCNLDQFPCVNGKCIQRNFFCDGENDCGDDSDEMFCGRELFVCPSNPPFRRCKNSDKCIPAEWFCDGRQDCPNGDDELEKNCGSSNEGIVKLRAAKWVYDHTFNNSAGVKWETFIHKAAVALFLAKPFSNISYSPLDIAKDVSIQFLTRVSQKKLSDVPSADLAASVNAMLVTCLNPRQFHGMNLIEELRTRVNNQKYTNPYVLLTLCNAGDTITEEDKNKLAETFRSKHREFWTDMKAMVILALSCAAKQPHNRVDEDMMKEFIDELKTHQYSNGSVANVQSTALVLQALYAAQPEEDPDNFDERKALLQIIASQKPEGSFGNFMEIYYVLPVLNCKSLVNISTDHCEFIQTDENSALQELADRVGPKIRVVYSLWFGDQTDMERSMALKVPANMSLYGVMEVAAKIDERYRFQYLVKNQKPYVNGISGLLDDPETGKFWFLHTIADEKPSPIPKSPADVIPKNNDHFVMWYRSGSWID